jgi:hypothetical protein
MFAGDRNFGAYDVADQAYEVLQKLLWLVCGVNLLAHFEQGTTLVTIKAPTAWPGLID